MEGTNGGEGGIEGMEERKGRTEGKGEGGKGEREVRKEWREGRKEGG